MAVIKHRKLTDVDLALIQNVHHDGLTIFFLDMNLVRLREFVRYIGAINIDGDVIREGSGINDHLSIASHIRRLNCRLLRHCSRLLTYGINHTVNVVVDFLTRRWDDV